MLYEVITEILMRQFCRRCLLGLFALSLLFSGSFSGSVCGASPQAPAPGVAEEIWVPVVSDQQWVVRITSYNVCYTKLLRFITRKVARGMVERNRGQIINLGSIAGKEPYPNGNVYCASKAAVDALTQGMRMDLP